MFSRHCRKNASVLLDVCYDNHVSVFCYITSVSDETCVRYGVEIDCRKIESETSVRRLLLVFPTLVLQGMMSSLTRGCSTSQEWVFAVCTYCLLLFLLYHCITQCMP